ncbi:MAG: HDIG domain-containing protein [Bacteroidales bacterium]|nr:HDIG domain-containing protein [Bacteroidales bacterium]
MKKARILVIILAVAAIMLALYPAGGRFKYKYHVGRAWSGESLVAEFNFPVLKTQEQLRTEMEEKSSTMLEYFRYDAGVSESIIDKMASASFDTIGPGVARAVKTVYAKGVLPEDKADRGDVILIKKGKRIVETSEAEVYRPEEAYQKIVSLVRGYYPGVKADSILSVSPLSEWVVPNLQYDENVTNRLHKEAVDYISPTSGMVYKGDQIVGKGELVTPEIAQILDSYKAETNAYYGLRRTDAASSLGRLAMVAMLLLLFFASIALTDINLLRRRGDLAFLLLLYTLVYVATSVFSAKDEIMLYLMPMSLFVLFSMEFYRNSVCLPIYAVALVPLLILRDSGVELFCMNLAAGCVLLLGSKSYRRGLRQFVNSAFIFVTLSLIYLLFRLAEHTAPDKLVLVFLILNSLMVVISRPFIYLLERLFGIVSQMRLWDLCDTSSPVLLELSKQAPGTFQHSLQVANLAESAAREIGADALLVRVGALYHDIGKSGNPPCFVENQLADSDYHKDLTPHQSVAMIVRHVDDGVEKARKEHLPEQVIDFIRSHHGTTVVTWFYAKHCDQGGDASLKSEFSYRGKLPQTKEQMIVMLADSVEAASRSLKSYALSDLEALVERIVRGKLDEGQADLCDITLAEISAVKRSLVNSLQQMYHTRIAYPDQK